MIRSDVVASQDVDVADIAPVRDLAEVLDQIQIDATANAAEYLNETKVPHGGE